MRPLRSLASLRGPHVRSKLSSQQARHFHPTKPAPFPDVASGFIYGIHALTGLPWVYSLPLTAITVRLLVAMPLQIYTKVHARREQNLAPILHSWKVNYQREIRWLRSRSHLKEPLLETAPKILDARRRPSVHRQESEARASAAQASEAFHHTPASELTKILKNRVEDRRKEIYSAWRVPRFYKAANFLQLPVWLMVMESVRNMCGDDRGLLRYIGSLIGNSWHPGEAFNSVPLEAEPSLATEGALWFPDLLVGDPTCILPVLLSASIILNIRTGWKGTPPKEAADLPRKEMLLRVFPASLKGPLYFLALYIGYSASFGMPSALMVYWLTSTNMATLQTVLLDKYLFTNPPLKSWRQIHAAFPRREQ
ncbi:inner membrane protein Cox18 [Aspergillus sp. HF37]|nr:inner membrane protein Cox18 [Aspergillus sp. HF37]